MSNSDRSQSLASHRSGATSSRPDFQAFLPGLSHGLSCPSLTPRSAHPDHPKMARNSIGNLWAVSTSDDVSTIGSLQLDQCSSVSTISTINPSATQHSTYASFHLHCHSTASVNSECAHQSLSNNIHVPSQDLFHDPIPHHNRRQKLGSMALISMNIGKPTRTTMTTRRSTAAFPRHSLICLNLEAGHRRM